MTWWYNKFLPAFTSRFAKRLQEEFAQSAPGLDHTKYGFIQVSKACYKVGFAPDAITLDLPRPGGRQR